MTRMTAALICGGWTAAVFVVGWWLGVVVGRAAGLRSASRVTLTNRLMPEARATLEAFTAGRYSRADWYGPGNPLTTIEAAQRIARQYLEADKATSDLGPVPAGRLSYTIAEGT